MNELLEYIYSQLSLYSDRVYSETVPEVDHLTGGFPQFPYLVYNLPSSTDDQLREDFILEVNVWDKTQDTTTLDNLADEIDNKLNRLKYIGTDFCTTIYKINRLMIGSENPLIKRRLLRYQVKTYFLK